MEKIYETLVTDQLKLEIHEQKTLINIYQKQASVLLESRNELLEQNAKLKKQKKVLVNEVQKQRTNVLDLKQKLREMTIDRDFWENECQKQQKQLNGLRKEIDCLNSEMEGLLDTIDHFCPNGLNGQTDNVLEKSTELLEHLNEQITVKLLQQKQDAYHCFLVHSLIQKLILAHLHNNEREMTKTSKTSWFPVSIFR